jgi:hypothetical protein
MKFSCITPDLSWEKCDMVLVEIKGVAGEHDEHYQMPTGT